MSEITTKPVYIITGASSDIGIAYISELEKQLKEEKSTAIVLAHYGTHAEELRNLISTLQNIKLNLFQADLSLSEERNRMYLEMEKYCECPDYILHMPAGKLIYGKLKDLDVNKVANEMEIQVYSFLDLCKLFLPKMAKRKAGKIVIMLSSVTRDLPPKFMTQYVTVKYALLGAMKSLAIEYGEKNICINGLSPSMVDTKLLSEIDDRMIEIVKSTYKENRLLSVKEVIPSINYLFSHKADEVNGENIPFILP